MSHVREGELHAYIDGALASIDAPSAERVTRHLETCRDCEERAEAARDLRDRASSLLDSALGGAIEAPPFEEIVEKAGVDIHARQSRSGRGAWRAQRFAWAASLVVALGAGWLANAVLRDSGGSAIRSVVEAPVRSAAESTTPASAESTTPASGDGGLVTEFETERQGLSDAVASSVGAQNEELGSELAGEAGNARRNVPSEAQRLDAPSADPEPDASTIETSDRRREAVAERLTEVPATPEVRDRARNLAPVDRVAQGRIEQAPALEASEEQVAKAASAGYYVEEIGLEGADLDSLYWRPVEVVEAAEWVGGILTLPDVEVEEYALSAHRGKRLARVRQRLPGGETLELVQLGSDAALDELREAPPLAFGDDALGRALSETGSRAGAFTLGWVEVNGVHVRASAPVAPDSLRTLISRIRRP